MTFPRPAARGEGQGEGFPRSKLVKPPLPNPLLHKSVEERENSKVNQKMKCAHSGLTARSRSTLASGSNTINPKRCCEQTPLANSFLDGPDRRDRASHHRPDRLSAGFSRRVGCG